MMNIYEATCMHKLQHPKMAQYNLYFKLYHQFAYII